MGVFVRVYYFIYWALNQSSPKYYATVGTMRYFQILRKFHIAKTIVIPSH